MLFNFENKPCEIINKQLVVENDDMSRTFYKEVSVHESDYMEFGKFWLFIKTVQSEIKIEQPVEPRMTDIIALEQDMINDNEDRRSYIINGELYVTQGLNENYTVYTEVDQSISDYCEKEKYWLLKEIISDEQMTTRMLNLAIFDEIEAYEESTHETRQYNQSQRDRDFAGGMNDIGLVFVEFFVMIFSILTVAGILSLFGVDNLLLVLALGIPLYKGLTIKYLKPLEYHRD